MKKLIAIILASISISSAPAFALEEIKDLSTLRDETFVSEYAEKFVQECYDAKLSKENKNLSLLRYQLAQVIGKLMSFDYECGLHLIVKIRNLLNEEVKKGNKIIEHTYNTTAETFCEKYSITCQPTLKGDSVDSLPLVIDVKNKNGNFAFFLYI